MHLQLIQIKYFPVKFPGTCPIWEVAGQKYLSEREARTAVRKLHGKRGKARLKLRDA